MSEEMIDVLDAQGEQTGRTLLKSEAHRLGEWHRAAHVWIVTSKGDLLLQRRAATKDTYPNRWDISSAGHISAGETSQQAAIREVQEELGVDIHQEELEFLGHVKVESEYNNGSYIDHEHHDIYLVTRDVTIEQLTMQQTEVADLRFLPWELVRDHVSANDQEFVPHAEEYKMVFSVVEKRYPHANSR